MIDEDDISWIDRKISDAEKHSDAPFSGTGVALKKMLEKLVLKSVGHLQDADVAELNDSLRFWIDLKE